MRLEDATGQYDRPSQANGALIVVRCASERPWGSARLDDVIGGDCDWR